MGKLPHTKDMPAPSAPAVPSNEITPYSIPPPQAPQSTTYNLGNQPATAYNVGCAPYNNPQTYVWAPQPHSSGPQQYGSPARPYGTATQQYSSAPQPYGMAQPFGKPHDGSYGSPYPLVSVPQYVASYPQNAGGYPPINAPGHLQPAAPYPLASPYYQAQQPFAPPPVYVEQQDNSKPSGNGSNCLKMCCAMCCALWMLDMIFD
eukprot:GHVT01063498.1.p1 GENE.GHVT01063498.1~~GHVT01063498.1.p1  ORF type:complete len:204 (+),score=14.62 GHVT01063498.1:354-965(+)